MPRTSSRTKTAKARPAKPLAEYHEKRDFGTTSEPRGARARKPSGALSFVVQAHDARRMHHDFRLELDGVLLSWAVPKGPSLDPKERRLAVQTEDHPIEYADFEGVIPDKQYGAGSVIVWDRGTWEPVGDAKKSLADGKLTFTLAGEKLRGRFHLVRTRAKGAKNQWLLFKGKDDAAIAGSGDGVIRARPESVVSGRTLDDVAKAPDRVWHSKDIRSELPDPSELEGAVEKAMPREIAPELATLSAGVPAGDGWVHEIKLDGYRILARLESGKVSLVTRNGKDWTAHMRSIAGELESWPLESAILDGEVVVLDDRGASSFQLLQNTLSDESASRLHYFVFDLLYLDGYDLRAAPLVDRKALLLPLVAKLAPKAGAIRPSDHFTGSGETVFAKACELGLEGIISKKASSPYRSGRGRDWLKIKCHIRQEVVIGGYTEPSGSRKGIGALVVGVHDAEGNLKYAGRVGTGFDARSLDELEKALAPLEIEEPPFVDPPRGAEARGVHWVTPKLLAEVEATEVTRAGKLRHPSFKGLRTDKSARDVPLEVPVELDENEIAPSKTTKKKSSAAKKTPAKKKEPPPRELRVRLTNPDRVYYPEANVTKRDLALYYASVGEVVLPYVRDRLISLVRCPDGIGGQRFYQRHAMRGMPEAIHTVPIREKDETRDYLYVSDLKGVVGLVQMGGLEIHGWGSRVGDIEHPDLLVIDLDPDEGLDWRRVIEAAVDVRDRLASLGLESFVRTTGGKGLHVVVPLVPKRDWDEVRGWAEAFANAMARDAPKKYTSVMSKARRTGRVFIDYLRNARTATAIVSWSTRAREPAPVAMPLRWEELADAKPTDFHIGNAAERAAADPWEGFFDAAKPLPKKPP